MPSSRAACWLATSADYRGWLLIAAALVLGFVFDLDIDSTLKPAIVAAIYIWLAWLMAVPARWCAVIEGRATAPASAREQAVAAAAPGGGGYRR